MWSPKKWEAIKNMANQLWSIDFIRLPIGKKWIENEK